MSSNERTHQKPHDKQSAKKDKTKHEKPPIKLAQMLEAPESLTYDEVIEAQQQLGNQVVQRALGNKNKRDAVTDKQGNLQPEISDDIQSQRGSGSPLPENLREEAGKRFKKDFKDVRLHTSDKADQLSRKINARAFTIGKDIFFKDGVYSPGTREGRETLIHELTHVVQQSGNKGKSGQLKLGGRDTTQEQEADRIGKQHSSTKAVPGNPAVGNAVQTYGEEEEETLQAQGEEEELQMQAQEEEEVQMQEPEEEEMLQAQGEEEEIQMQAQEEEETLQPQGEEEEIQAQPDTVGVVQRITFEEELKQKSEEFEERAKIRKVTKDKSLGATKIKSKQEYISDIKPGKEELETDVNERKMGSEEHMKDLSKFDESRSMFTAKLPSRVREKRKRRGIGTKEHERRLGKLETGVPDWAKEEYKAESVEKKKESTKQNWENTLKNPDSSPEEVKEAKEKLTTFHKDSFSKKDFKEAQSERRKALEEKAKTGDEDAYKKWKSESKGAKAKSGAKKALGGLWGATKGLFGTVGKDLKEHFLGKEKKKEAPPSPSELKMSGEIKMTGGGGGGGMMEIMEKYSDLKTENKGLREKLGMPDKENE